MLEPLIEQFISDCRRRKISVTVQRIAVYRDLINTDTHPTAEEIYQRLSAQFPMLSLATVYKTLETFEKNGFITKSRAGGESARYDANKKLHHHLVCRVCGKMEDLYDDKLEGITVSSSVTREYDVHHYRIDFFGTCPQCKTKT